MRQVEPHKPVSDGLHIRLFGPLDARIDGLPLPRLRTHKGYWLLALMALRNGLGIQRNWLAGHLWPDSSERQGLANLRLSLTDLRHALASHAGCIESATAHTLRLNLLPVQIDVTAFDEACASNDVVSLQEAVRLYRGPLLEGCYEEWAMAERDARERAYLTALETLAEHAHASRDLTAAVRYLRLAVAADPSREKTHCALMRALADMQDYAAVVEVYCKLREVLISRFNMSPDPQTVALFQELRSRGRKHAPEDSPRGTSLPSAPVVPSGNLPRALGRFVGREAEIESITEHLDQFALLTLIGPGGIGKTQLALQVARRVAENCRDGAWFIDLSSLTDEEHVPQQFANELCVREQPGRSILETLTDYLSNRRMLIIIDNCEHVTHTCAVVASTLLTQCNDIRILATSREALNIEGELCWRVPSLDFPDPETMRSPGALTATAMMKYDAVRLFVHVAQRKRREFKLTTENARAVAEVCARLDGLPLALELAAGRMGAMAVEEIAARMHDRFQLLQSPNRTSNPRHQTLLTAFDWSYDLLDPAERSLLAALSIFAGGWTLEAAEVICSETTHAETRMETGQEETCDRAVLRQDVSDSVLDRLTRLVDKSQVLFEEQSSGEARYRLLNSIREFSALKLAQSDAGAGLRTRHRDYFFDLALKTNKLLTGPEHALWLERLEQEHNNLRAAFDFCLEDPAGTEQSLHFAAMMSQFFEIRGYTSEATEWYTAARRREDASAYPRRLASVLHYAGHMAWYRGDLVEAWSLYERCLPIYRQLDLKHQISLTLRYMGQVATQRANDQEAWALYEESLAVARELGKSVTIAGALANLAVQARINNDLALSASLWAESNSLSRESGDMRAYAFSLGGEAEVAYYQGQFDEAEAHYNEALKIHIEMGDKRFEAMTLSGLGRVAESRGDLDAARSLHYRSMAICEELHEKTGTASALGSLGDIARRKEEFDTARELYERSLILWRQLQDGRGISTTLDHLASLP